MTDFIIEKLILGNKINFIVTRSKLNMSWAHQQALDTTHNRSDSSTVKSILVKPSPSF